VARHLVHHETLRYAFRRCASQGDGCRVGPAEGERDATLLRRRRYGSTKAAIVSMTAAVAAGYAEHGISAYALQPWITDTPMIDRLTGGSAESRAQLTAMNPSGRIVSPAEVAAMVLRLAEDGGAQNSGRAMVIDAA
jgi:NAD(P)-dependent dehydrogenase (short-subunit alcohol dehydrogenase family)